MKHKAVIFDMDGTLVNSIYALTYSINNVLEKHGMEKISVEQCKLFVGNGIKELVRKAAGIDNPDDERLALYYGDMIDEYSRNWDFEMYVYDGITELLDFLKKNGIKLGVNTNKNENIAKLIVDKYFPGYFSYMVGGRPSVPRKPDPAGALLIAEKFGVKPEECVYLGDSNVDIKTAKIANMYAAGALWGFRSREELLMAGADVVIEKPDELIKIFLNPS
ncbi:phosphoglycolate phosphatase [Thermoclostridium stercorarium subsp. stercorarium DSM 8532]|uniref:Phosphoglycolate phosphatase n=2 Tax=Thermoclostridium stercorarium TaxID=1510 RepID=L7VQW9_THES1|nr:HAD family hydrolase [Thermoclostridium stercorarium]AGC69069.1 phosphoglycolate phosphatase [Thermoclostridium stercorarium subsp. stercorarium DSM 8532]AGI40041.1 haloacid dehalogenase [Thermoclostridium stercorarium subsp. stercorarium DSM 8532]ANW99360.1 phosphoglycolate phosphatase [Thermoclostridium stercorarium subsp. thermolacticum DSM 2910]